MKEIILTTEDRQQVDDIIELINNRTKVESRIYHKRNEKRIIIGGFFDILLKFIFQDPGYFKQFNDVVNLNSIYKRYYVILEFMLNNLRGKNERLVWKNYILQNSAGRKREIKVFKISKGTYEVLFALKEIIVD